MNDLLTAVRAMNRKDIAAGKEKEMEQTKDVFGEISCDEIQSMMDQILGQNTFSFTDYVDQILQGKIPFSLQDTLQTILHGFAANIVQEKKIYMYLVLIALLGAVLGNFASLMQGGQVADIAFYAVYLLFFSVLLTAFANIAQIAQKTLESLFDFVRILVPSFFSAMVFSQGCAGTEVYYQFTLCMIAIVECVLVQFVLPAIHIYFLLQVANQISPQDMFSKMADLIRDVVRFVMKAMFGIMMGINVIQGMIVPLTSRLEQSAFLKMAGAIPGVGNTVSSVAGTMLCAGSLVKNAIGVAGVIAILFVCGVPLLRLYLHRFLFQLVNAVIQPVADKRIVQCISAMVETVGLLAYAVFVGCMMFVVAIALMSVMTGNGN